MRVDDQITELYLLMRRASDDRHAEFFYKRLRQEFCIDIIPEIDLPMPFRFVHPLATVLGRATYAPHLVVYQNVGVGSNLRRERPTFTGPCVLFPGAKVLGRSVIGKNVYITANTVVNDCNAPDNCIVYSETWGGDGADRRPVKPGFRRTTRSVINDFFPPLRKPTPESLAELGAL